MKWDMQLEIRQSKKYNMDSFPLTFPNKIRGYTLKCSPPFLFLKNPCPPYFKVPQKSGPPL